MVGETAEWELRAARLLLLAIVPVLFVSTSLTVGIEIALYALFALSRTLRTRLRSSMASPAAVALAIFSIILVLGALHGPAPWPERWGAVNGSRKLLLFFLGIAVFDDEKAKEVFLSSLLWLCAVAVSLSYVSLVVPITYEQLGDGIVLKDHAIQGLVFATGVAVALWFKPSVWRAVLAALLAINVAFVGTGRVGYLALAIVGAVLGVRRGGRWRWLALACIAVVVSSPLVHDRVALGLNEMEHVEQSPTQTSMGWRLVMWRNAVELIGEHPIFGVGTGSFETAYRAQVRGEAGWKSDPTNDPHNQYLKLWAEQGIVGLLAFGSFIVAVAFTENRFRDLNLSVLLAWCAASLFASYFSRFVEGRFIFLLLGVLAAGGSGTFEPRRIRFLLAHVRSVLRSSGPAHDLE
jgi:O-antigen ligase